MQNKLINATRCDNKNDDDVPQTMVKGIYILKSQALISREAKHKQPATTFTYVQVSKPAHYNDHASHRNLLPPLTPQPPMYRVHDCRYQLFDAITRCNSKVLGHWGCRRWSRRLKVIVEERQQVHCGRLGPSVVEQVPKHGERPQQCKDKQTARDNNVGSAFHLPPKHRGRSTTTTATTQNNIVHAINLPIRGTSTRHEKQKTQCGHQHCHKRKQQQPQQQHQQQHNNPLQQHNDKGKQTNELAQTHGQQDP
jgi:hypothetical protein